MIVTTTEIIPGRKIKEIIGMVAGTDIYLVGGVFGGGLANQEKLFDNAFSNAEKHMIEKAIGAGADAIIGVKTNYTAPGGINNMILVLIGTAVKLELSDEEMQKNVDEIRQREELIKQEEKKLKNEKEEEEAYILRQADDANEEVLRRIYNSNPKYRKRIVLSMCAKLDSEFTTRDVYSLFNEEVPLMDLGAYLKRLVDDGKLTINAETSRYSIIKE